MENASDYAGYCGATRTDYANWSLFGKEILHDHTVLGQMVRGVVGVVDKKTADANNAVIKQQNETNWNRAIAVIEGRNAELGKQLGPLIGTAVVGVTGAILLPVVGGLLAPVGGLLGSVVGDALDHNLPPALMFAPKEFQDKALRIMAQQREMIQDAKNKIKARQEAEERAKNAPPPTPIDTAQTRTTNTPAQKATDGKPTTSNKKWWIIGACSVGVLLLIGLAFALKK
jgi:hypothetical protein